MKPPSREKPPAPKIILLLPTWEEICALRSVLRERESYKRRDGSWQSKEALEETHLVESLLSKERRRYHLFS